MSFSIVKRIKNRVNNWYIPVIIGVFFVLGGFYFLATPIASYLSLAIIFSILFLFSGIFEVAFALSNKKEMDNWGWLLFSGIVDIILGVILVTSPALTMAVLPIYVGIMLMFRSIRSMAMALHLKDYGSKNWGGLFVLSILGLIFSIFMVTNLEFGAFTIVYWTAFSFVFIGFFGIYYGFQLKKLKNVGAEYGVEIEKKMEALENEVKNMMGK